MHDSLIKYLNNYLSNPLTEDNIELIKKAFTPRLIRKRQYLLQAGDICKYSAFIVNGSMRQYKVDGKGAEHIIGLFIENWWAVDRESYIMLTPSIYNIDALEETDALMMTRADQVTLFNSIPSLTELTQKLDERHAIATQNRLSDFVSLSAEKRYARLAETYPEFLQRFPQHIIASYLGITKETLSRVRKQAMRK